MARTNQMIAAAVGALIVGATGTAMLTSNSASNETVQTTDTTDSSPAPDAELRFQPQVAVRETISNAPITHETDTLAFSAHFPQAPEMRFIAAALKEEAGAYLERTRREAQESATNASTPPWEINIVWETVATSNGYASLIGRAYEYRGGAHPVQLVDTKFMNIAAETEHNQAELFASRAWPTPAVAIAVCEELKAAKLEVVGDPTIFGEPIVCAGPRSNIHLDEAKLAFAASQTGTGFGGLHVLYQPYILGSYAEGAYEFTIPADVFLEDVSKESRTLFTGDPVPLEN